MNDSLGIQFRLVPRAELTSPQKGEMFQLMSQHFDGVTPEQFARDLAEKNLALLLERHETLVGFSTLLAYATMMEKKPVNVIYSGDTIVTPAAWARRPCREHGSPGWKRCAPRCRQDDASGCCLPLAFALTASCQCSGACFFRALTQLRRPTKSVCSTFWRRNASVLSSIRVRALCISLTHNGCAQG